MDIGDLRLLQAVVEVRFPHAYYIWDRSGHLWSRLGSQLVDLRMISAVPNQVIFRLRDSYEFAVKLESASIVAFKPNRALTDFSDHAEKFFRDVADVLEIAEYTRVGCRLIFVKDYPSLEQAAKGVMGFRLLNWPEGKHFNISGPPIEPECAFRFENDNNGVQVRIKAEERTYGFEPPLIWEGTAPEKKVSTVLTYDIDLYTRAPVLVTQLSYSEWIKQCIHVTNRDSNAFLGGSK